MDEGMFEAISSVGFEEDSSGLDDADEDDVGPVLTINPGLLPTRDEEKVYEYEKEVETHLRHFIDFDDSPAAKYLRFRMSFYERFEYAKRISQRAGYANQLVYKLHIAWNQLPKSAWKEKSIHEFIQFGNKVSLHARKWMAWYKKLTELDWLYSQPWGDIAVRHQAEDLEEKYYLPHLLSYDETALKRNAWLKQAFSKERYFVPQRRSYPELRGF